MTIRILRIVTPALAAGAAAAAIAVAPVASAADQSHLACSYQTPGNSQCETPGNAQLTATPQDLPYQPQYPFLLGALVIDHHGSSHGIR